LSGHRLFEMNDVVNYGGGVAAFPILRYGAEEW